MPAAVQRRVRWLVALFLPAALARATLIPGPNLARRIEQSDLVVVARIRDGTISDSNGRTASSLVLHVERVLKGQAAAGADLSASIEGRGMFVVSKPSTRSAPPMRGIWLLKAAGGGYLLVPRAPDFAELGFVPVPLPAGAPAGSAGNTCAVSVANELVSALEWLAAAHGGELAPAARVETAGARRIPHRFFGQYGSEALRLTESLRTLPDEVIHPAYRKLAGEPSPHLRAIGIAGLISLNDPDGPKRAEADLKTLAAQADVAPIVEALIGFHQDRDPDAVRAIARLAQSGLGIPLLEENASYALRALHTIDAMPALVALLDSSEPEVRANALAGICLFVRSAPVVTPDAVRTMAWMQSREPAPLRTPETDRFCWMGGSPAEAARLTDHVAFWKSWWRNHSSP